MFAEDEGAFYTGNLFLPETISKDLHALQNFIQHIRRHTDSAAPDAKSLRGFHEAWEEISPKTIQYLKVETDDDEHTKVIKPLCRLLILHNFGIDRIESFLNVSVEKKLYETWDETLEYMHDSAGAIGHLAARILGLPKEASEYAAAQAKAVYYLDLVRNIAKHSEQGRRYFPRRDFDKFGLKNLEEVTVHKKPDRFEAYVRWQIARYFEFQKEADKILVHLPWRTRVALRAMNDEHNRLAKKIAKNPFMVYEGNFPKPNVIWRLGSVFVHLFD